jgi:MFS family permease
MTVIKMARTYLGLERDSIKALTAALFGFLLDAYDLLIILSLLPTIQILFFPELTGVLGLLATYGTLTITLIFRPLGSSLFGYYTDKIGRQRILVITITGFAIITFLMGLLPTHAQAGVLAPILLYILRAVQGIFIGGEYAAGNPFALEFAPQNRRGLVSGMLAAAFDAGVLLSSFVVYVLSSTLTGDAFLSYGWRIAFFTGIIPAALALYIRLTVPESRVWVKMKTQAAVSKRSIREVGPLIVATSLLMAGFLYTYYSTVGVYTTLVKTYLNYSTAMASLVLTVTNGLLLLTHLGAGYMSDIIGRRLSLIILGIISIILTIPTFQFITTISANYNYLLITLAITGAIVNSAYAIHGAYVTESYSTLLRGFGYGLSYAIGLIIGGFAPMILISIGALIGSIFTAIIINVVIGQLLVVIIALLRPETRYLAMER